ncbi:MAG: hypothetical protein LT082_05920 [Comamonas sp.]|nr:hypothetical protein [Comamonas sp.]
MRAQINLAAPAKKAAGKKRDDPTVRHGGLKPDVNWQRPSPGVAVFQI